MPTYKLPPEKKHKSHSSDITADDWQTADDWPDEWARSIQLPVNDKILNTLSVGDKVDITIQGEVTETSKRDSSDEKRRSITVKVSQVDAYTEDYDKKADMDMKKGFKKGPQSHNSHSDY